MKINEMNSITVYDSLNRKHVIKVGETWMNGSFGVCTIDRIFNYNGKKFSNHVWFTVKGGQQYSAEAEDMGSGRYELHVNFLFKIA